jgi:aminoglycoside phosphotransferase (APT) family kinase protein
MHDDEVSVDAELVRRLMSEQLPAWAGLPVRPVGRGTVNAMFRLGDDLVVRLPRTATWAGDLDREREWLPRLRDRLTLEARSR